MPRLEVRGAELEWSERGEEGRPTALLVHETAVDRRAWDPVSQALGAHGARAISYDRRGWGGSGAPPGYARTTVEEQSEDAAGLLEGLLEGRQGVAPGVPGGAVLAGAGLGAIVALDLAARRPDLVAGTVLVEPPLLSLLPEATELLAADLRTLEAAAGEGRESLVGLYLSGRLGALGAGAGRLPDALTAPARERPASLIAEIGAVPAWRMSVPRLAEATRPAAILTSAATPPLLLAAARALADRLANAEHRGLNADGPPHLAAPAEVAEAVRELGELGELG